MKHNKRGFTLIELLVVVLIIGILASVALPKYQVAVEKTRTVNLLTLLKSLQRAQQAYYLANGEYTQDPEVLAVSYPAGSTVNGSGIVLPNKQKIVLSDTKFLAKTDQVQLQVEYSGGNGSCWATDDTVSRRVCASLGKAMGYGGTCSLLGNKTCYGYNIIF